MKHLSFLLAAFLLVPAAQKSAAQMISITASPDSQTVSPSGTFNVSLTVTVPAGSGPSDLAGFDLFLVTAAANSGNFSITAASPTGPFNSSGPDDSSGDPLATPAANGFVQNGIDQGFNDFGTAQSVPVTNLGLETLTLSVAANTPADTYRFQTSTTPTAAPGDFSDVTDSNGTAYEATSAGTFSITVVPEPSSGALLLLGAAGAGVAAGVRRWRRAA